MKFLTAVLVLMITSVACAQTATVIFYRSRAIYASGRRTTINVDGKKVCSLANGRFYKMTLPLGEHEFAGPNKKKGGKLTLEADRVYYFATRLDAGLFQMNNFWAIYPVSNEQGAFEVNNLKANDP